MVEASQTVAKLLTQRLDAPGCAIIMEGMEIDYAHIKVIPLHNRAESDTQPKESVSYDVYPGFITTQPGLSVS